MHLTFLLFTVLLIDDLVERPIPHSPFNAADAAGLGGGLLVVAGALLRSWAAGTVHKNHALATAGPYSLTRHPLYLGSLLIGLGFCVLIGDDENHWAVLALFALVYLPKLRAEEQSLALLFGERWAVYTRRTGCFHPRCWSPRLLAPWSLQAWLRNREYQALVAVLAGLAAMHALAPPG